MEFEAGCDLLRESGEAEDRGRLLAGEVAALLQQEYGWGGLKEAAKTAHREYKTVAERARVVSYYQRLSAGQIFPGSSVARELLDEYPLLTWTHLRVAKGLDKSNPQVALQALRDGQDMTPLEFKRYIAQLKAGTGWHPERYIFQARAGYTVIVKRDE